MAYTCDMEKDCKEPVTYIGEKGYIYCAKHAPYRRYCESCRKLAVWERDLIKAGKQVPSYRRIPKPAPADLAKLYA